MRKGALNERIDIYLWLLSTVVNRLSFADAECQMMNVTHCDILCYLRYSD